MLCYNSSAHTLNHTNTWTHQILFSILPLTLRPLVQIVRLCSDSFYYTYGFVLLMRLRFTCFRDSMYPSVQRLRFILNHKSLWYLLWCVLVVVYETHSRYIFKKVLAKCTSSNFADTPDNVYPRSSYFTNSLKSISIKCMFVSTFTDTSITTCTHLQKILQQTTSGVSPSPIKAPSTDSQTSKSYLGPVSKEWPYVFRPEV